MSSQSAQHRTAHGPSVPVKPALEPPKVNDWDAPVSWWWLPAIGGGAYVLFAYVVPAAANLLLELFH
ncbi:hypothetical protein UB45_07725 [Terrabacter sp. 28]|nr:hypothetical protein UB45_07725 [Terrabacter sp. 28]